MTGLMLEIKLFLFQKNQFFPARKLNKISQIYSIVKATLLSIFHQPSSSRKKEGKNFLSHGTMASFNSIVFVFRQSSLPFSQKNVCIDSFAAVPY